jgi:nucleoside-diphosphate-sugar epimerase
MLGHTQATASPPKRVVLIGAGGFIGGAIAKRVREVGVPLEALGRHEVDLLGAQAATQLAARLRADDAVVVISAIAPCKNPAMMVDNIRMMGAVCDALTARPVSHVVYLSSDAVYADGPLPLNESSPVAPTSLHGAMHLAREQMLAAVVGDTPLAILRPTLVYGAGDPHNGYGPNRFRRLANRGERIVLFGGGEERRDHVLVDDIAELALRVLQHRSTGILNVATGAVASFRALAEQAVALASKHVAIEGSPRNGPMPHGGYRPFDPAATAKAFPDFRYTPLAEGLAQAQQQEFG